jgi:hypothetical protein
MGTGFTSLRLVDGAAEATRRVSDAEVRELADQAFRASVAIIEGHRPELDQLAQTLLDNEVLERDDIDAIMADVPRVSDNRRGSAGKLRIAAAAAAPSPSAKRSGPPAGGR